MGILRGLVSAGLQIVGAFTGNGWLYAAGLGLNAYDAKVEKAKARRGQIEQLNAAAKDRLVMVDLQADAPRTLCLGRVRYVEGIRRRWTSGTNSEQLTMIVSFAGHEIDAFEQWYLDDTPVTLDASGYVLEEPWSRGKEVPESVGVTFSLGGTITLPHTPVAGSVRAHWVSGSGENGSEGDVSITVSGNVVTVTGGLGSTTGFITYTYLQGAKRVRIRPYLGTATQNVGADLAAEYPGKISSTDRFAGIALAVVDFWYDPDVFPTGWNAVTPVFRGAKCFNPATGLTVWTENPALCARKYATWSSGWALQASDIQDSDVTAAAAICAASTSFPLTTGTVSLPLYRCGIAISADADHGAAMESIMATMNGRHGWAGGVWRMRAGALSSSVATIDESWLVTPVDELDVPVLNAVQALPREQRFNRITGRCIDSAQRYQLLPFPAVEDSTLVAAKGERSKEVTYEGVSHIAHAQHLASMAIRRAQAGLRLEMLCGPQAFLLELFDVVSVTLPDYGYSAKACEVTGWEAGLQQAYGLTLEETAAALYTVDATLDGRDPAPDSSLRAPWDVEDITITGVTAGSSSVTDTSILSRTIVNLSGATTANIRTGGRIEVAYTPAGQALPAGDWPSQLEPGDATKSVIPALLAGRFYLFRARAVQQMPLVYGSWSPMVRAQIGARRATKSFVQASAPTGDVIEGDRWTDTDDGNKQYQYISGAWTPLPAGTAALASEAATKIITGFLAGPVTVSSSG